MPVQNPNEIFSTIEFFIVRIAVFLIFLVGLFKVFVDTTKKILK